MRNINFNWLVSALFAVALLACPFIANAADMPAGDMNKAGDMDHKAQVHHKHHQKHHHKNHHKSQTEVKHEG